MLRMGGDFGMFRNAQPDDPDNGLCAHQDKHALPFRVRDFTIDQKTADFLRSLHPEGLEAIAR